MVTSESHSQRVSERRSGPAANSAGDPAAGLRIVPAELRLGAARPVTVPRLLLPALTASSAARPMVRVFIGTELAQHRAERILLWSILLYRDPARAYEITLLRDAPGQYRRLGWATRFSNFRFLVPHLAGPTGKVIYNDVDQVYLGDPGELFDVSLDGAGYGAIAPRETSVMLLDCERMSLVWSPEEIARRSRRGMVDRATEVPDLFRAIDPGWNCRDEDAYDPAKAKLYHFTTLHIQPWRPFPERFVYHENPQAKLWWDLRRSADAAGFQVFGPQRRLGGALPRETGPPAPAETLAEARELLKRAGAEHAWVIGADDLQAGALGVADLASLSLAELAEGEGEIRDAALWLSGADAVGPDDVPWLLAELFRRARRLVYVRASCRAGRARFPLWPPRGSVGTERWWIDQMQSVATCFPEVRWEVDLIQRGRRPRRLRPGGQVGLSADRPVWLLVDGTPESERTGRALADALGTPYELYRVEEARWLAALRGLLGSPLCNALAGATSRGLEGLCIGPATTAWPDLLISVGSVCAPRARFLREASGHRMRVVQLDGDAASPTARIDLVVTPASLGALAHPRRIESAELGDARNPPSGRLRHAIATRAFRRPGNDRGTTRPQQGMEALFSRLLADGLAGRPPAGDGTPPSHDASPPDERAQVARRVHALLKRSR